MRRSQKEAKHMTGWMLQTMLYSVWCGVCVLPALAQGPPVPLSDPFLINTYQQDNQTRPRIAMQDDGSFIAVWASIAADNGDPDFSVQGQRFEADGTLVGPAFLVNSYTTGYQGRPDLVMDAFGGFVVVWQSGGAVDDPDNSVQGQRFDPSANPVGDQFTVNSYTSGNQQDPRIDMDASGAFLVVWERDLAGGTTVDTIHGRRFHSDGSPTGLEFDISTDAASNAETPVVATEAGGNATFIWRSDAADGGGNSFGTIRGRRFDANDTPLGSVFRVNTLVSGNQRFPNIADHPNGEFVVVWSHRPYDPDRIPPETIHGQRFGVGGIPEGTQFRVSTSDSDQVHPSAALDASGTFTVVWQNGNFDYQIKGRRFDSSGQDLGDEFEVIPAQFFVNRTAVDTDTDGNFVVVWGSYDRASNDLDILGRRFCGNQCVFADGFESGNTTAWAATQGL